VTGVDASPGMLAEARRVLGPSGALINIALDPSTGMFE
jgi:ubiquinone/menaquinone biosynthesis C-methylase UbiE